MFRKFRNNTIYISRLSWITGSPELRQYFESFGKVANSVVHMDNYRGISKGSAFVQFENQEGMESVLKQSKHHIDGAEVQIKEHAMDRQQNNTEATYTGHGHETIYVSQ